MPHSFWRLTWHFLRRFSIIALRRVTFWGLVCVHIQVKRKGTDPASPVRPTWSLLILYYFCANNFIQGVPRKCRWQFLVTGNTSHRDTSLFVNYCVSLSSRQWTRYNNLFLGATASSGQGPPHSLSCYITHNDAPQSVGLLWKSDHLVAKTSTWQHTSLTTDKHPCSRWDSNPQSQQAGGRRPTP